MNRTRSIYIYSPGWLKNKKATINIKNNDDNCFQYVLTAAINHKQIKNHPERKSNLKLFINQYDWKGKKFPSQKADQKKFKLNNKSIALNILFAPYNAENIRLACKSKHNFKRENQVVLLMITDREKMVLSCCEKILCITQRNNIESCWKLLLFKIVFT